MKQPEDLGLRPVTAKQKKQAIIGFFLFVFFGAVIFSASQVDKSLFEGLISSWTGSGEESMSTARGRPVPGSPFRCALSYKTQSCGPPPKSKPSTLNHASPKASCPEYFRWIHEDLRPWKKSGITKEMVQRAAKLATFRLLVVNGRLYIESYGYAFETRDVFNWWGFVQLLRKYPGRIPDLDLMFHCGDRPNVLANDFFPHGKELPPPVFSYCTDEHTLNLPFPDWSFWGWIEVNIKPWVPLSKDLKDANERKKWEDREPYAFWKGNPHVSPERMNLLTCNQTKDHDWNARFFEQDWGRERREGFRSSSLADQCTYRYKIYIEGIGWSVSQKYILACDSMTLRVVPFFDDFFTRGLIPLEHYWPIKRESKCSSIKFAVDWGNTNKEQAQAIGRNASKLILEDLKIENVYDYMFHLLNEYAKLLRYKPRVPPNAVEVCFDSMLCHAQEGREKNFMMDSQANITQDSIPCSLPPPFTSKEMELISKTRDQAVKLVESWEKSSKST